jgi:geranylgeranyl reductase family protein
MDHDVIIVGAGPAGSATAWHLARAGIPTLLVDKADFPRDKVCGDCLSPRAQHFLGRMGLLESVTAAAHAATRIHFRAPGGAAAMTEISGHGTLPDRTLVLARHRFDHLVQQHALGAGAQFRVGHVRKLLPDGGVRLHGERLAARLTVIATGATLSLLKHTPLAPRRRVHSAAARCYVQGMELPGSELRIFLDQMPLPGYAWLFPTAPQAANLGYWYHGRKPISAPNQLARLLTEHSELRAFARDAARAERINGYPIRSDFLHAPKHAAGVLAVGEAAGLVNPFTGEGIDYALESAELAATVILGALRMAPTGAPLPARSLRAYPRMLNRRFRGLFLTMSIAGRLAASPRMSDRLLGRGERGQRFLDDFVQVCFGAAPPLPLLAPTALGGFLLGRPARGRA